MSEPKPFASLNPSLLARKGGAKPAMRSQLATMQFDNLARAHDDHDDLGWNDMGHDEVQHSAEIVPIGTPPIPEVVRQQRAMARQVAGERRSALADGRRAAFTLRVDAERHLKLRLACTVQGRSAQQLVTEALDRLLDELPDLAALANQLAKSRSPKPNR